MRRFFTLLALTASLFWAAGPVLAQIKGSPAKPDSTWAKFMQEAQARRLNHPYPEFTFKLNNGTTVSSAGLKGKIVVIDCWFEGCHPCMAEIGALNELNDSLSKHKDIVFFSLAREREEDIARIAAAQGIRYPVASILANANRYTLSGGYPTKIIIDREGTVVYYQGGGSSDSSKAREHVIREFLPEILAIAARKTP